MATVIPDPIPPVYRELKDLCIATALVTRGAPQVTIVTPEAGAYDRLAQSIQRTVADLTGTEVPIASDDASEASLPAQGNVIALGNRSTNRMIGELYDRHYTLLDLRYPGPGGHVLRSLHNSFGNGYNVIFLGGSDLAGVAAATDALLTRLAKAEHNAGSLSVGWLMDIELGNEIEASTDLADLRTWEDDATDSPRGWGWNSISKHMAAYYMTGKDEHAREFLRLAFPDEQAKRELAEIDDERIENKDAPLSGPYHYAAHLMVLFWDLIEESPIFTDQERLRVTNAFAQQLPHRAREEGIWELTGPASSVGTRHTMWAAVSTYCLGRYFQKYYPAPVWQHCMDLGFRAFASLSRHGDVSGESDTHYAYNTCLSPILTFLLLAGERAPVANGVAAELLRGQDILASGATPDWALTYGTVAFLHKAAYLLRDSRYVDYARRNGSDLSVFRLGQSFWPDEALQSRRSVDLAGAWRIHRMPESMWQARHSPISLADAFQFCSFRSTDHGDGDFVLLDGYSGTGRSPYHSFAVLELRLAGYTLLRGHLNQARIWIDGMVEPRVARDAALRSHGVIGQTAIAVGEVPDAAFCNWRRTVLQRVGRYALIVDELTFRTDAPSADVEAKWEGMAGQWVAVPERSAIAIEAVRPESSGPVQDFEILASEQVSIAVTSAAPPLGASEDGTVATMRWTGPARRNGRRLMFSLIAARSTRAGEPLRCQRVAANAAILAVPSAGLAVVGAYDGIDGELTVVTADHLFGKSFRSVGFAQTRLLTSDSPIDVDWDFQNAVLTVVAENATRLQIAAEGVTDSDSHIHWTLQGDMAVAELPPGRHVFERVMLRSAACESIRHTCASLLVDRGREHQPAKVGPGPREKTSPSSLQTTVACNMGNRVECLITIPHEGDALVCAASDSNMCVFSSDGERLHILRTSADVTRLHWWPDPCLLLAGCADGSVAAFGPDGSHQWTFASEMDPAVLRMGKPYWFRSAPEHGGIQGLSSGVFLNGESQAFVGSACTLEILDGSGRLVKRLPVFFGPGTKMGLVDGPEDSINLLIARQPSDGPGLAVVNSRHPEPPPFFGPEIQITSVAREFSNHVSYVCPTLHSFHRVPEGHTDIAGGFASTAVDRLFCGDIDGDGEAEVVCAVNGSWSRVTVYARNGAPRGNAQFGPGEPLSVVEPGKAQKSIRDLELIDCAGTKRLVVGTSRGAVVALDHQCNRIWAERLDAPPTVIRSLASANAGHELLAIACEDGGLVVLDGDGRITHAGQVTGVPTCAATLKDALFVATDQGVVQGFRLP